MVYDLKNESCLPKETVLWILKAKYAACVTCPLDQFGRQVVQLVCLTNFDVVDEGQK